MAITITRLSRPVRISTGGRGYNQIAFSANCSATSTHPASGFEKYFKSIDNVQINMLSHVRTMIWKKQGAPRSGIFIEITASTTSGFVDTAAATKFRFTAFGIV